MNAIVRLNWLGAGIEYNEFNEIAEKVELYLTKANMLSDYFSIGNFCINGIPDNVSEDIKNTFKATKIDFHREFITKEQLSSLKVGDKVTIDTYGMFGLAATKGTVYSINGDQVTIKKYRSKTKGWIIEPGQLGSMKIGWTK